MPGSPANFAEERVAQLQVISERRNVLLKEMYQLMQRRGNVGAFFDPAAVPDGPGLQRFIDNFSLSKGQHGGSISNLPESAFALVEGHLPNVGPSLVLPAANVSSSHIFDGALTSPEEDKMDDPESDGLSLVYPPSTPQQTPMEVDTPRADPPVLPPSTTMFNFVPPSPVPLPLPVAPVEPTTPNPLKRKLGPAPLNTRKFTPQYTLPPLNALPVEFNPRKKGSSKQQRKREKERERAGAAGNEKKDREEWVPMGLNKWSATLNANPVWKRLAKATKCVSTREWGVAMAELKLIRTLERVDVLKDAKEGNWSFRQPKKQRTVGVLAKTHWDHLIDEMKWMRIDFREERKWKLALAYNLGTAVLEWHATETREARIEQGICVNTQSPPVHDKQDLTWEPPSHDPFAMEESFPPVSPMAIDAPLNVLSMVDYGSDDEDDDEQEKDVAQSLSLEPTVLEDALMQIEESMSAVEPKIEDVDDRAVLEASLDGREGSKVDEEGTASGLKTSSTDPVLGGTPFVEAVAVFKPKTNVYAHLRERIAYSDLTELFLDITNLEPSATPPPPPSESTSEVAVSESVTFEPPPPLDLSSIFPDLQPYGLLPLGPLTMADGKIKPERERKYNKDDITKRPEDLSYTKLAPIGRFMHCKPTLLGALQPAKRWKSGRWVNLDDTPIFPEADGPPVRPDNHMCALFEAVKLDGQPSRNTPLFNPMYFPRPPMDPAKRTPDHLWLPQEDELLRDLVIKYPGNWYLVADAFHSLRVSISTDKRSTWDCFERWNVRWGNGSRLPALPGAAPVIPPGSPPSTAASEMSPHPSGSVNTRGVKRTPSVSVSGPVYASAGSGEPRKQRRHALMFDSIRKAAKKRDQAAKIAQTTRKPPNMHDTHAQYGKMAQYSPFELSRMKYDKELQEQNRRRAEEAQRQQMLQQARQQQQEQMAQHHQMQMQNEGGAPAGSAPGVSRLPSQFPQVNISQQRMSPQQLLQAQAVAAQTRAVQAAQQVQAQAQAAAAGVPYPPQPGQARASTSSPAVAHASPAQASPSPRPPSAQANMGSRRAAPVYPSPS